MKKGMYICFLAGIFVLALALSIGTLIFGGSAPGANEQLAKAPALQNADGSWNQNILQDTQSWFSDRFFLRKELISLHNYLYGKLFSASASDSIVLGSNHWLYYKDTLPSYTGSPAISDRNLFMIANNLSLISQYAENAGSSFVFAIAPNKNSVYPQYMPKSITPAAKRDALRLFALLDKVGVPYVNLFDAFESSGEILYFAHDSHWNSKGAALAADEITAAFGIPTDYYSQVFTPGNAHQGDLYTMLYPAFSDNESDLCYGGELSFTITGSGKAPDSITLETRGAGSGKLLAYRDSFGNLLYPYLSNCTQEATFSRSVVYDLTPSFDYLLLEIVERNLYYLYHNAPVMPAPATELSLPAVTEGTVPVTEKIVSGYRQLSGSLPVAPEETTKIYLTANGVAYEAFLLESGGFSACLPESAEPVAVVYSHSGGYSLLNIER